MQIPVPEEIAVYFDAVLDPSSELVLFILIHLQEYLPLHYQALEYCVHVVFNAGQCLVKKRELGLGNALADL